MPDEDKIAFYKINIVHSVRSAGSILENKHFRLLYLYSAYIPILPSHLQGANNCTLTVYSDLGNQINCISFNKRI